MTVQPLVDVCDRLRQAHDISDDRIGLLDDCFLPAGASLQPEDGGRDRLSSLPGRLPVEVLGNLGGRLDVTLVEFAPIVLAQRLRIEVKNAGDVGLGYPVTRHGLDLTPARWIGPVGSAAHVSGTGFGWAGAQVRRHPAIYGLLRSARYVARSSRSAASAP